MDVRNEIMGVRMGLVKPFKTIKNRLRYGGSLCNLFTWLNFNALQAFCKI